MGGNNKIEWEIYSDPCYYDMWAVRPVGDKDFNSPRLFHFIAKGDAEQFKELVEKSMCSIPAVEKPVKAPQKIADLKPSVFSAAPSGCRVGGLATERIAAYIMRCRVAMGDKWDLTWDEFRMGLERETGNTGVEYSPEDRQSFEDVMNMIPDGLGAACFCYPWEIQARAALEAA